MCNNRENNIKSQIFLFGGKTRKKMRFLTKFYLNKYNLSISEVEILLFIKLSGKNTSKDYVDYSGMSRSLVSKNVDSLVKKGFLVQAQDPSDRRVFHLHLNEKAKDFVDSYKELKKKTLDCVLQGISDEEIEVMEKIMERMTNNLDVAIKDITGGKQE